MSRRYRKRNQAPLTIMDDMILVGVGAVLGGIGVWLYMRSQTSTDETVDAQNVQPGQIDPATGTVRIGPGGSTQPLGPSAAYT